jgi:hypothetical protein
MSYRRRCHFTRPWCNALFELMNIEHYISVVGPPEENRNISRTVPEGPRRGGLLLCRDMLIEGHSTSGRFVSVSHVA